MTTSSLRRHQFPRNAYRFVFDALHQTQRRLYKAQPEIETETESHISGPELLEGIRRLALKQFGLMSTTVFQQWGIENTEDFGRLVFELIERGEMKKNDSDSIADFCGIYSFDQEFDQKYRIPAQRAFDE
jgi:uncharacterized repeat protein (TIGR04138 family)